MRRIVYNGPARGLFGADNFSKYMARYSYSGGRPTETKKVLEGEKSFVYTIKSQEVKILYKSEPRSQKDALNRRVSVTISARGKKLGEIEKRILSKAKRFGNGRLTQSRIARVDSAHDPVYESADEARHRREWGTEDTTYWMHHDML
mgnify:CR=1 FL=1